MKVARVMDNEELKQTINEYTMNNRLDGWTKTAMKERLLAARDQYQHVIDDINRVIAE